MAKVRNQHFVPRVYLKNWETQVSSKNEPRKYFDGIYYYEKNDLETGDGRNKNSILYQARLYNINYKLSFILPSCHRIEDDYINQLKDMLVSRGVNAYCKGHLLKTRKDLARSFFNLDDWEFKYKSNPDNTASKRGVITEIKKINSYVIENALDSVVEDKWQKSLENFIHQMEETVPLNGVDGIRQIDENTVLEIVKMVVFLICRNPDFNYLGILPQIKQLIIDSLPEGENDEEKERKEEFIKNQMYAVWLRELYSGLYNEPRGYFYNMLETAQSTFQVILYKAQENQGNFITSDKPAFEHVSLVEFKNLNSIICPLTPQYLIMIMKGDKYSLKNVDFRTVNNDVIRKLNRIILSHSQKAIISNYKHLGYIL